MRLGLLGLGAIAALGACDSAMAQVIPVPVVEAKRLTKIGVNVDAAYDSNIAHTNEALSAVRGITPEDETVTPSVVVDLVYPLGRQAVFLNGEAGYDFHRVNKQLDRQNVDLTGGGVVVTGPCHSTLFGNYTAAQSDLADTGVGVVKNLTTTGTEGLGVNCGAATGLTGSASYQHQDLTNSATKQQTANHRSDGGAASFGYGRPSLGTLQLTGNYSTQTFPNRINAAGQVGDSYWDQMLGISYSKTFGSKLKFDGTVGRSTLHRDSAPAGVPLTVSGTSYSVVAEYVLNSRLSFQGEAARQFQPSSRAGKLYDLATTAQVTVNYNLGTRFLIALGGLYEELSSNTDTSVAAPISPDKSREKAAFGSVRYRQSQKISLLLDLRREERTTNLPSFDYTDNRVTLTLAVNF